MRVPARRDKPNHGLTVENRLVRHHVGVDRIHGEGAKRPRRSGGLFRDRCRLADEIDGFVVGHKAVHAGFCRAEVRPELALPRAEELLQPQAHHRPHAKGAHAVRGPGLGQHVVKPVLLVGVDVDLIAQIAGVADPLHQRLIGADVDGAGVHKPQGRC